MYKRVSRFRLLPRDHQTSLCRSWFLFVAVLALGHGAGLCWETENVAVALALVCARGVFPTRHTRMYSIVTRADEQPALPKSTVTDDPCRGMWSEAKDG